MSKVPTSLRQPKGDLMVEIRADLLNAVKSKCRENHVTLRHLVEFYFQVYLDSLKEGSRKKGR